MSSWQRPEPQHFLDVAKMGSVWTPGNAEGSGQRAPACVGGSGVGACRGAGCPVWTRACHRARSAMACGCRPDR